ncbi:MAG: amino acid racemase [Candidatus Mcinerneyibacterium aminivorans]|jgi:aspartate racemase|uniref:Amino acid racemase n=1 Tax=Candidatus Mcinerneyibacterium aminivorans TaxID=2703815 RepID=A0A5D0MHM6_9BACT|nr:MAG: amino acid racemase [Candidatus Mcinerneyibacterium aminivorans]
MKKIGIIGGLSWESSRKYYSKINRKINRRLGGNNSAEIILYSLNFKDIEKLQSKGKWNKVYEKIKMAGKSLERADADFIIIASNTIHKIYPELASSLKVPIYHIVDALESRIKRLSKVAILGTSITLSDEFITGRIEKKYNVEVLKPPSEKIEIVNKIIFKNLVKGIINKDVEKEFQDVLKYFLKKEVKYVILACTELQMLIKNNKFFNRFNFIDTLEEHCNLAVEKSLT